MTKLARLAGAIGAMVAAALGGVSLIAWGVGGWRMARLGPDGVPIGPITGLLFVVLGLAVAALMRWPETRAARNAGLVSAVAVLVVSSLAALQWWRHFKLPWDGWLLGAETVVGAMPLGRMSPATAIAFLLTSVAMLAQLAPSRARMALRWTALLAGTGAFATGLEVVASSAAGTPRYYGGTTTPMAVLTAVAFVAVNLGVLLRSAGDPLSAWLGPGNPGEDRPFRGKEVLALVSLIALIAFSALFYLRTEQTVARNAAHQQLDAIAKLKAAQIAAWRSERLGEAAFLLRTRAVAQDVADILARPQSAIEKAQLIDWLEPIRGGMRYESAMVFTPDARMLLSVPASATSLAPPPTAAFEKALGSSDVVFADLYRNPGDSEIHLDLLVPIRLPRRPGPDAAVAQMTKPIAVIVLRLDPNHVLFPLIREWPVPSQTAEALLVRRDGDDVVYLSDLRTAPNSALTLRRPMNTPYLPAAMGLRGDEEVREGLDYGGTVVLATSRAIPGSPWVLEVKIDQAEAFGPIRREAWQTGTLVGLLILALVLAGGFFSWQRRSDFLRRVLRAEQERNLLAGRLSLITKHANDIILLTDRQGRVLEANERALSEYGYTLEEIRALPPGGLRPPETAAELGSHLAILETQDGAVFETVHQHRDGSTFPVEMSARAISVGGERAFLFITRDITQRRAHEAEIDRLNRLYAAHSQVNQAIVRSDTRDALLGEVCRGLVQAGGFQMAWVGRPDPATGLVEVIAHFGDKSGYLRGIRITIDETPEARGPTGTAIREARTVVSNDFQRDPATAPWREAARRAGFGASMALPVRLGETSTGALTVYAAEAGFFGFREIALIEEAAVDINFGLASIDREEQRAKAEEALARSEERLRLTLIAGHQGLYDLDIETGEAVVSPEYAIMLGYDPASFHETNAAWIERLHPDDHEPVAQVFADYVAGRRSDYRVEFRQRTQTGEWKWILSVGRIVERTRDGRPLRMLGTHTDITDLKRAEAALAASEVRYRRLFESAKDGILILDAGTGMVVDVNPFLIDLLGFSREAFLGKAIWDLGFFRDVVANQDAFALLQDQEYIRYEDRPLKTAEGRQIDVEFVSNVYLVAGAKVIQCNIRDITDRRQAELALRASLREKEALLKEVHHRVKNNLQVITSLLRLEAGRNGEPGIRNVLKDMQGRIRSMALLHETLYRTGNFARVDLAEYLRQLATQLFRTQNTEASRIQLTLDLASAPVDIDQAIPCGLIVNELLTNSLKYAFVDGRAGVVRLGLHREPDGPVKLTVIDTGSGLPKDFEARKGRSLGLQLVSDLVKQLAGTLKVEPAPGAAFTLVFTPHLPHGGGDPDS